MPTDKQRRDAERRRRARQQQRRGQAQQRRRRRNLIFSIVGVLVVAGVVVGLLVATHGDNSKAGALGGSPSVDPIPTNSVPTSSVPTNPASSSTSTSPSESVAPGACSFRRTGQAARKVTVPSDHAPTSGTATVHVATNRGALTFTLDRAKAPCAVENFVSLARQRYFDRTPCHRLTTQGIFVLQCGDPTGTGTGGPGYSFNDELHGTEKYTRGVLAMANSGQDTNGSQFFIVYRNSTLGPQYTVFGEVTSGLGVVDKVAAKGPVSGTDGKPKLPVEITKASAAT